MSYIIFPLYNYFPSLIITLCSLCAKGYAISHVYMCYKISAVWHLPNQKKKQKRKKHLWHFHFALTCRHRGYDGQLPVYFRSSATPVSLLLHNVLSWVAAPQKSDQ